MKFDDLEVGMFIRGGIITSLYKAGTDINMDQFWGGCNAITHFMTGDAYIGQCTFTCDDDTTFDEYHVRDSDEYKKEIIRMAKQRNQAALDASDDLVMLFTFLGGVGAT